MHGFSSHLHHGMGMQYSTMHHRPNFSWPFRYGHGGWPSSTLMRSLQHHLPNIISRKVMDDIHHVHHDDPYRQGDQCDVGDIGPVNGDHVQAVDDLLQRKQEQEPKLDLTLKL
ncbi:hypothetical protein Sjap_012219 [Stephania japonica]|uniref:Uncharacterized protein n=1 Tax=Stephania japonica TaxID=461633 RepID=A0AAP0NWJ8_9MAGN